MCGAKPKLVQSDREGCVRPKKEGELYDLGVRQRSVPLVLWQA